jgi:hypothetical protein
MNHDIEHGGYHDVSSHIAPLALAIKKYGPDVLELGCGWYSTPMIHALSGVALSVDTDPAWVKKFESLAPPGHIFRVESPLDAVRASIRKWQVVFIDLAYDYHRVACAEFFLDTHCCIVAHDTQEPYWQDLLKTVKYQRHFDFMSPRTSFLSNVLDVTKE